MIFSMWDGAEQPNARTPQPAATVRDLSGATTDGDRDAAASSRNILKRIEFNAQANSATTNPKGKSTVAVVHRTFKKYAPLWAIQKSCQKGVEHKRWTMAVI
jgi:hypothetical protein